MNVIVTRDAAINAEGGCTVAAHLYRKQARLRKNAGPHMAHHRAWLRQMAEAQEAAARELRRGIDAADDSAPGSLTLTADDQATLHDQLGVDLGVTLAEYLGKTA